MRPGDRNQPAEERVRRRVLNKVVGQNSCRLFGTSAAEAARPQVSDQAAQRRPFSDEAAVAGPGDEIDMRIDALGSALRRI